MNHNNIEFWQEVKEDYLENNNMAYLCTASNDFRREWLENWEEIVLLAIEFTNQSRAYKQSRLFFKEYCLFTNKNNSPLKEKRKIRMCFLNYMIKKLSKK